MCEKQNVKLLTLFIQIHNTRNTKTMDDQVETRVDN